MGPFNKSILLCFCLAAFAAGPILAQQARNLPPAGVRSKVSASEDGGQFTPVWQEAMQVSSKEDLDRFFTAPHFQGAGFDGKVVNLPYYEVLVPVSATQDLRLAGVQPLNVNEESSEYFNESIKEADDLGSSDWYPSRHVVLGPRVVQRKQHFRTLQIYPMLVSTSGDRVRKAEKVNWSTSRVSLPASSAMTSQVSNKTQATNSVLSSGNWYKIGVTEEGIFKLDYNYLKGLGINVDNIDPRQIKLYGNGGGMLPQRVDEFRHDDLAQNRVLVVGENDGKFDDGDYLLFYGDSPHKWKYANKLGRMAHFYNVYSDTNFYFLTVSDGMGTRIQEIPSASGVTQTPTSVTNFAFHEQDEFNSILSGRAWLGETFDFTTQRNFTFPMTNLAPGSNLTITTRVGVRSASNRSSFTVKAEGQQIASLEPLTVNPAQYGDFYYKVDWAENTFPASSISGGALDVDLTFSKANVSAVGWLDFIEVLYKSQLKMTGGSPFFYSVVDGVGAGEVFQYNISNLTSGVTVWNVTDPVEVQKHAYTSSGGSLSFAAAAESIQRFVVFAESDHKTPASGKAIGNQDLHGLSQAEYLIITHPILINQANELADFHRSEFNRSVHVIDITQIWNEFGSGRMDPSAIRDFINLFYRRAATPDEAPKYVLLFGDGSYDYKDRVAPGLTNLVPTYQSRKSQRPTESYTSDDFYGFLDDSEGFWGENASKEGGINDVLWLADGDTAVVTHHLDVAVARIPAGSVEEAQIVVDKIKNYATNPVTYGPWRNELTLVADHKDLDGKIHLTQADSYTNKIKSKNPCINIDKIYLDNYDQINTANGVRHPDAKEELKTRLNDGSLIVNYTGHGGETGWSNSKILEISDIQNLSNGYRLPAYITATCEFGRFDDPDRQSGAEKVLVQQGGGAIAMFTTVRVVYSGPNYYLNTNFYDYALSYDSTLGRMPTMGEVFTRTKNASWLNGINNRNFTLLGDPALQLNYPELHGVITSINGSAVQEGVIDSLPSLSLVTIEGEVRNDNGQLVSDFNGDLFTTVFDKPAKFITKRKPFTFYWQKNKVFNGEASVQNGKFSVQFVVPIDISYEDGLGKISLYFHDNTRDGGGCNGEIYIGGTGGIVDDKGPELEIFMNDEKFSDGGMVGPDPLMIVSLFDENGINTVGTGIGHELTAVLNDDPNDVLVLNDYYTANKNSYQEGRIEYPFEALPEGEHSVYVKVWDVANNSAEGSTTFIVADNAEMALGHVLNYPNPFTTNTKFFIEHNQNGKLLDVQIKIYTVSGRMVKSMEDSFFAEGNMYCDIDWDGLDEFGDKIGRGVYVYQVLLRDAESGEKVSKFEKLVVLR